MKVDIHAMLHESTAILIEEARKNKEVLNLIREMDKFLDVEEILDSKGYELIMHYDNQEKEILETLFIYFNEEAVIEASKNQSSGEKRFRAFFTVGDENNKKILKLTSEKEKITALNEVDYKKEFYDFLAKGEQTEENLVSTEAWYDGCLIFGDPGSGYHYYRHCGSKCGDKGSTGGGTPINALDACCRAHDRCYSVFGANDCGCDQDLGRCADNTSSPGWYLVGAWAYDKSCN